MASSLAPTVVGFQACSKMKLSTPLHYLPLRASFASARGARCGRRSLSMAASSSEEENPSTSSTISIARLESLKSAVLELTSRHCMHKVDQHQDQIRSRGRFWGGIGRWIVVCCSVPFSLYTLPFLYGDFEIYKHLTVNAIVRKNYELAGLHIANHLPTWQIHAAAALLYMAIGPFQFNPAFRLKHPVIHKRLGYTFAVCTIITAVTGATTMRSVSELGPIAVGMTPFMSVGTLIALAIAIHAARCHQFQRHRRWMLRSAAIGYAVMYTRLLPGFIQVVCKVSGEEALDYSFPLSVALNSGLVELYIYTYLRSEADHLKAPDAPDSSSEKVL